jgi:hypothetical protein
MPAPLKVVLGEIRGGRARRKVRRSGRWFRCSRKGKGRKMVEEKKSTGR